MSGAGCMSSMSQSLVTMLSYDTRALRVALHGMPHYKIAEAVSIHREIPYVDLSHKANLDLTNLCRIVRHAMTNHIFREPRNGSCQTQEILDRYFIIE